ncbi:MAG TPA: PQQ-binding-like beta-propeller repeat protein [Tepidisphaeraceae bacterium]|jgi:outer membrane protein assembly factor BamB|nr:PQQ-binding-like beta-propeller repeat protein [Tepidisphaeraceae bacterium]
MKSSIQNVLLAALTTASLASICSTAGANDWYRWRGPEQDGVSRETNLPEKWSPDGDNVAWTAPVGGMSSPIVMKGKLYTITRVGEVPAGEGAQASLDPGPKTQEAVVCLDAKTGKQIWEHGANMYMTDDPFHRIGWSNVVGDPATGRVFALGAQNELDCLDGETGKVIWHHQATEEYGIISTFGGRTPSPAIDENHLYVCAVAFGWADNAGAAYRVFCFDKNTGQPVWTNLTGGIPTDAPYQTPVIANINGEHVLVTGSGDGGCYAFQARTGKKIWGFKCAKRGFNSSVVVRGNRVYVNWDLDNIDSTKLGRIICLDAEQVVNGAPKELWRIDGIEAGFPSSTLTADGKTLYVADDKAIIYAVDTATGRMKYRSHGLGTIGKASLVWADGKLYFPEANGRMSILKPDDEKKKFDVLSKVDIPDKMGREYDLFGSVAIADGHVYLQASNKMFCIGPKEFAVQSVAIPPGPAEEPAGGAQKTAMVQVVPCDVSLKLGESAKFTATAFDAKGRAIGEIKPQWSIDKLTLPAPRARPAALIRPGGAGGAAAPGAPAAKPAPAPSAPPSASTQPAAPIKAGTLQGEVSADGTFTSAKGVTIQGGGVFAADNGVTGFARVRVFSPLPWHFDFEKDVLGKPPLTWIGAGMKFAVHDLEVDGKPNKVLTKLTDIPLFARARTYFGQPDMANYTVQGDVMVRETVLNDNGQVIHKMPDVGIIDSRYVLELKGANQWLGLHAWPAALPRDEREPGLAPHVAVNFPWKADEWYHLKLTVEQTPGKATCRGKAWKAGDAEPKDWMVTLTHDTPNTHGSPGLWGFSNAHEIYYDNLIVTPNLTNAQAAAK